MDAFPSPDRSPRKIPLGEAEHFVREGFEGFIHVPLTQGEGFSALTIYVDGSHPRKRMIEGTRTYYVTEGEGTFTLGETKHDVKEGDFFVIPSGGEYSYEGQMALFEMNVASHDGKVVDEKVD